MSFGFRKLYNGINIVPQNTTAVSVAGDVRYNSSNNQFEVYNTGVDTIATANNTLTLTNKTLTTPVIASITSGSGTFTLNTTGTITVPNGTDTLVGLALTQTLTNKVLTGNTAVNLVSGSGTFVLNTTGTITAPNGTDTLAGISLTQSITNKTLGSTNTATGINMASFTPDAGTHTLTAPLVTDTLTANAATQTLTNKTLGSTNTATGINMASFTPDSGTHTLTAPTVTDTLTANAATQTLTNKTFGDAPIFTEISTPSSPSSGLLKVYPKTDNNLYTLNSSGIETLVGSGSGGTNPSTKNYLSTITTSNGANSISGNLETGSVSSFTLGSFATVTNGLPASAPTFGGSVGTLALSVNNGSPLAGNYSLNLANSGTSTNTAGSFFSTIPFYIDKEDQAKVLSYKFSYNTANGAASLNYSGTSSNTLAVAIWDVTNSAWIVPAGVFNIVQSSGVGIAQGTFQTTSNSTQYRLVVYFANTTTGVNTIFNFDDFYVGPQSLAFGPAMSDFTSYTPTITGDSAPSIKTFTWYRHGDKVYLSGTFVVGTPTSSNFSLTLPSGMSIDYTKLSTTTQFLGSGILSQSNNYMYASGAGLAVFSDGSTTGSLFISYHNDTNAISKVSGTTILAAGNQVSFSNIAVPIAGWSSNTSMSADTDTRVVSFKTSAGSGGITSTVSNTLTTLIFNSASVKQDTHAAYNATTGLYTVPVSGTYVILSTAAIDGTFAVNNSIILTGIKNGTTFATQYTRGAASQTFNQGRLYTSISCNAGDTLGVQVYCDATSPTFDVTSDISSIEIFRLSGPAVVAASESVNASYVNSNGGTSTSNAFTCPTNWAKSWDTHNAMNASTGVYTVPVAGTYQVNGALSIDIPSSQPMAGSYLQLQKNGTSYANGVVGNTTSTYANTISTVFTINKLIKCVPGDTIQIGLIENTGANRSFSVNTLNNYFDIARVGN